MIQGPETWENAQARWTWSKSLPDTSAARQRRGRRREERSFELSLPALVKGLDAAGRKFEERTAVCGISAQEVSFRLKARLIIDSRVTLFLDIPRTLILESPLRMVLSGAVVYVRLRGEERPASSSSSSGSTAASASIRTALPPA
ncbi:MAG: hypothetical protein MZU95_01805 [Desulfomicrobium escambiense]|nr:hypothetical protein [Desulfomicrobium escambiense]